MKNIKMKLIRTQSMIFFFLSFIFIISCGDSKFEMAQAELKKANTRLNEIESDFKAVNEKLYLVQSEKEKLMYEISIHKRNLEKLNIDNQLLSRKYDDLSPKYDELNNWSRELIDRLGAGIWYIDDFTIPIFVKSMREADAKSIVKELNKRFEKDQLPKIFLKRISKRTAHIKIDNPDMLTQQMGTHGARSFMNAVVYSLASIGKIDCVWFEFDEGDHAIPGKYCR